MPHYIRVNLRFDSSSVKALLNKQGCGRGKESFQSVHTQDNCADILPSPFQFIGCAIYAFCVAQFLDLMHLLVPLRPSWQKEIGG